MKFIDEVTIRVKAGDGGDGAVAFRREKFVPKGGPAGGDGGRGGDVVLVADGGLSTLLDFHYRHDHQAPHGQPGATKDKYGRSGQDLELRIPCGTEVKDAHSHELLADLKQHDERFVVAAGGKGGRGNIHFATSTDRAPHRSETGLPGQQRDLRLELKLLADVGIVGFPNVGKSSLISRISAARPKIADYPFTTLVPNLGVVRLSDDGYRSRTLVVADVPGLIEGAHAGAGLGLRFLRHLERTRVLLHVLDVSPDPGRDPIKDYQTLRREIDLFDPELGQRRQVVALNKIDLNDTYEKYEKLQKKFARLKINLLAFSAVTGRGIPALLEELWRAVHAPAAAAPAAMPTVAPRTSGPRRSSSRRSPSRKPAPRKVAPRKSEARKTVAAKTKRKPKRKPNSRAKPKTRGG